MPVGFLSYRTISVCAAALCGVLGFSLLVLPVIVYWIFGIMGNDTTDFMSRRAAMLFLGFAIILFQSRNAPNSAIRRSLSLGVWVAMLGLAATGLFEFAIGRAGGGIWLAIVTELAFAAAYFKFWTDRSPLAK